MKRIQKMRLVFSCFIALAALLFVVPVEAQPYGSGLYGSCAYQTCSITLSTSGTVSLPLTPNSSGVYTIDKDVVTVTTGNTPGYVVTLESNDANSTLVNGANTIAAVSGSFASPAALTANTWGYRIDSAGGFGAGPTSTVTSTGSSSLTFAPLAASGSGTTIISTTSPAPGPSGVSTNVWYGVYANSSKPNGTYTRTITYTALTKS